MGTHSKPLCHQKSKVSRCQETRWSGWTDSAFGIEGVVLRQSPAHVWGVPILASVVASGKRPIALKMSGCRGLGVGPPQGTGAGVFCECESLLFCMVGRTGSPQPPGKAPTWVLFCLTAHTWYMFQKLTSGSRHTSHLLVLLKVGMRIFHVKNGFLDSLEELGHLVTLGPVPARLGGRGPRWAFQAG